MHQRNSHVGAPGTERNRAGRKPGSMLAWKMIFFVWSRSSVTTAARPTSEPVPAVVGTATQGAMPATSTRSHQSSRSSKSKSGRVWPDINATHFAASIADPPPNATTPEGRALGSEPAPRRPRPPRRRRDATPPQRDVRCDATPPRRDAAATRRHHNAMPPRRDATATRRPSRRDATTRRRRDVTPPQRDAITTRRRRDATSAAPRVFRTRRGAVAVVGDERGNAAVDVRLGRVASHRAVDGAAPEALDRVRDYRPGVEDARVRHQQRPRNAELGARDLRQRQRLATQGRATPGRGASGRLSTARPGGSRVLRAKSTAGPFDGVFRHAIHCILKAAFGLRARRRSPRCGRGRSGCSSGSSSPRAAESRRPRGADRAATPTRAHGARGLGACLGELAEKLLRDACGRRRDCYAAQRSRVRPYCSKWLAYACESSLSSLWLIFQLLANHPSDFVRRPSLQDRCKPNSEKTVRARGT